MFNRLTLISAAITAFVLIVLGGVTAATISQANSQTTQLAQPSAVVPTVTATVPAMITPQDAASAASVFMGQEDMFSVESSLWNTVEAYKVTFSSGEVVYVGLDGQILAAVSPTPVTVVTIPNPSSNPVTVSVPNTGGGDHDDHDDHDDDHGDDD